MAARGLGSTAGQRVRQSKPDNQRQTAVAIVSTSQNIQYDGNVRSKPGWITCATLTFNSGAVTKREINWTNKYQPNA